MPAACSVNGEQVDGWIDAATFELGANDIAAITTAIETTGAGQGPVTPFAGVTAT